MKPGAGPRHFVFHPSSRFVYAINELNSTIAALTFDAASGALSHLQTVPALPSGYRDESHCAGVQLTPDGRYLFGSNRGHDSLVVYAVDESTGRLSFVEHHSCLGKTPRDFAIDPSGRFLLVANQNSDAVVVLRIDPKTGKLTDTGARAECRHADVRQVRSLVTDRTHWTSRKPCSIFRGSPSPRRTEDMDAAARCREDMGGTRT